MKDSLRTGLTFGLTSAVITTLGLMVGLHSGTRSRVAVLGGILTIAIADAMSDALGIHVSEEAKNSRDGKHIWTATVTTFLAKSTFSLSFAVAVFLLPLSTAIIVNVSWGLLALAIMSYLMARSQGEAPWKVIGEHLLIAVVVIGITHYVGEWVHTLS